MCHIAPPPTYPQHQLVQGWVGTMVQLLHGLVEVVVHLAGMQEDRRSGGRSVSKVGAQDHGGAQDHVMQE